MMNHLLLKLILLGLCIWSGELAATPLDPSEALRSKDYGSLSRLYQAQIENSASPTSTMYYNLGVVYMLMGDRIEAIRHYDMALYLEPTHREARHNLNLIYKEASNSLGDGRSPVAKLFDPLCYMLTLRSWAIWALVSFSVMLVGLGAFFISGSSKRKRIGFYSAVVGLSFVVLINAAILHQVYYRAFLERKVTVRDVTGVFLTASAETEVLATLTPPSSLVLLREEEEWIKIRLLDNREGWVRKADVALPLMLKNQ